MVIGCLRGDRGRACSDGRVRDVSICDSAEQGEIGIRVALGAQSADVLRLLSSRPLRFAALGVLLGIRGIYAATPAFRSVLYNVPPNDPITLGAAAAGVPAIALTTTIMAIWRALKVDPAVVLRDE
jgi:ABC-type lipoprotein release transport system permease subunit